MTEMTTAAAVRAAIASGELVHYGDMTKLARKLGRSRERIRQLRVKFGGQPLKSRVPSPKACLVCGKPLSGYAKRYVGGSRAAGIHVKCYKKTGMVQIHCAYCGKYVMKARSQLKHSRHKVGFCDRTCRSHWLGDRYRGRPRNGPDRVLGAL